jgi:hypothetical protein
LPSTTRWFVFVAVVIVLVQITGPAVACPEGMDPDRPYSLMCGEDWNPFTDANGFAEFGCSMPA